jgi:hypothetical protein
MSKLLFIMPVVLCLTTILCQTTFAQGTQNNTQTVLPLSTVVRDLLEERGVAQGVQVIYESPKTIIFRSDIGPNATLAFAIDTAKENGFSVDGISASSTEQANGEDIYTVFMSKK